jgi:hypothetical protein
MKTQALNEEDSDAGGFLNFHNARMDISIRVNTYFLTVCVKFTKVHL